MEGIPSGFIKVNVPNHYVGIEDTKTPEGLENWRETAEYKSETKLANWEQRISTLRGCGGFWYNPRR